MSDIEGKNQRLFEDTLKKLGFLTLEYSGHGKSSEILQRKYF